MKRIISLIVALGLASSFLMAQQPANLAAEPTPTVQAEPVTYTSQTGSLVLFSQGRAVQVEMRYELFPQPVTHQLNLVLATNQPVQPTIYLTDTDGNRLPYVAETQVPDTYQAMTLNLKKLEEGMYLLVVEVPGLGQAEGMPILKLNAMPVMIQ